MDSLTSQIQRKIIVRDFQYEINYKLLWLKAYWVHFDRSQMTEYKCIKNIIILIYLYFVNIK